jgi:hypothetical protein
VDHTDIDAAYPPEMRAEAARMLAEAQRAPEVPIEDAAERAGAIAGAQERARQEHQPEKPAVRPEHEKQLSKRFDTQLRAVEAMLRSEIQSLKRDRVLGADTTERERLVEKAKSDARKRRAIILIQAMNSGLLEYGPEYNDPTQGLTPEEIAEVNAAVGEE